MCGCELHSGVGGGLCTCNCPSHSRCPKAAKDPRPCCNSEVNSSRHAPGCATAMRNYVRDLPRNSPPVSVVLHPDELHALLEATRTEARREHRHEWADYLAGWLGAVGPTPPTVEAIIAALRAESLPFGCEAGR